MFLSRLKKSGKIIGEAVLWLIGVITIMLILERVEPFRSMIITVGGFILYGLLLIVFGSMLLTYVNWQFVEPYKKWKKNKKSL